MKNEIKRIKSEFKNAPIKAIISSGGYVSFPLVFSFKNNKKVKKILLEPNSVIGLANKVLSFKVDYICTQFDISKNAKFITTGNPIKINNPIFDHPSFYKNSNMILFVGGSNGALEIVKLAYDFNYNFPDVETTDLLERARLIFESDIDIDEKRELAEMVYSLYLSAKEQIKKFSENK